MVCGWEKKSLGELYFSRLFSFGLFKAGELTGLVLLPGHLTNILNGEGQGAGYNGTLYVIEEKQPGKKFF